MARQLNVIAAEVMTDWFQYVKVPAKDRPHFIVISWPYLEAMLSLRSIDESYGLEEGLMIVLRFLNNAHQWRGEKARAIKAELNELVKDFNARHHRV